MGTAQQHRHRAVFKSYICAHFPENLDMIQQGHLKRAQIFLTYCSLCALPRKRTRRPTKYANASSPFLLGSLAPSQTPQYAKTFSPPQPFLPLIIHSYISPSTTQRTEIPDLFVNILDAIFIDASSWKSNLAAYGMWI